MLAPPARAGTLVWTRWDCLARVVHAQREPHSIGLAPTIPVVFEDPPANGDDTVHHLFWGTEVFADRAHENEERLKQGMTPSL